MSLCDTCRKADVNCPICPQETDSCVEYQAEFPPLTCNWGRPVAWYYQLDHVEGTEHPTNSVTIFSRPQLSVDESGRFGFEKFNVVTLTRAEIAEILKCLEEDIANMRKYCPDEEFI